MTITMGNTNANEQHAGTDVLLANSVKLAVAQLNTAINGALRAGLRVNVDVDCTERSTMDGDARRWPRVTARVARPL